MMKGSRCAAIVGLTIVLRLLLVLSVALTLLAASAGTAGATVDRTLGSVYVQLKNGQGLAKLRFRGNVFVNVDRGRVTVSPNVNVAGADFPPQTLASGLILYRGRNLAFHTPSYEPWRVRLNGSGIDASGFVRGCMTLNAADSGPTGSFRITQRAPLRAWPRLARSYKLGRGC